MRRRVPGAFAIFVVPLGFAGEPQTNTNVIAAAQDAFGIILGPESLGLYSPGSVRGFSPITAGNVRLDGLYFDQQGGMIDRLVRDTRIRVGLSAVNFPWPAPTGIVDYALRAPKGERGLSALLYFGAYQSREVDVDGYQTFCGKHCGIAMGASYRHDVGLPGFDTRISSFGILPQWTLNEDVAVQAFWGRLNVVDQKAQPIVYVGAEQTAPRIPQHYYGQNWAIADYSTEDYGVLAHAKLSPHWSVRAGIFQSVYDIPRNYVDLYLDAFGGVGEHVVIAQPDQYYGSSSGELQIAYTLARKSWRQELVLGVRGRRVHSRYGGDDSIDFGSGAVGQFEALSRPDFVFGDRTGDRIREFSPEVSYSVQWNKYADLTVGIQRPNYVREVVGPSSAISSTSVQPWLYNSSLVLRPAKRLAMFGTVTRGLEDSGLAPGGASNRNAVLGAARSSQEEVGVKYLLGASVSLETAAFEIQKPYFALNEQNLFTNLGRQRYRGVEVSLTRQVSTGLSWVAGAMFLSPEVSAAAAQEPIGTRPVGQPAWITQLGVDYRFARFPRVSLDCTIGALGSRMARVDNRAEVAGYGTVDLGVRYQVRLGSLSTTVRVQLLNATNTYNWYVGSDGGLQAIGPRRAWAYFVVDL